MVRKKSAPITGWEASTKQLEAWVVVCVFSLGNMSVDPGTYKVLGLLGEATGVGVRLRGRRAHVFFRHEPPHGEA